MTALPTAAEWGIVALSLKVSLVAVVLTLPLAYALAWLLARRLIQARIMLDDSEH
jgi:molybdate transport system permease protein